MLLDDGTAQDEEEVDSTFPYKVEDFGVLELQEYVAQAFLCKIQDSEVLQLYTVDQNNDEIRMNVYKIKQSFEDKIRHP